MKRAHLIGLIALGLAVGVAVFLFGSEKDAPKGPADPNNEQQVALGETVYNQHCAACHGANLEGQPNWKTPLANGRLPAPPHDESGHTWHHADEVLFRITKEGIAALVPDYESDMPVYRDVLSDEEIWAVLAFIKSRWPKEIQERQASINQEN